MNNWSVKVTDQCLPLRDLESVGDWGLALDHSNVDTLMTLRLLATPVYPSYEGDDFSL